jgi:hypothetical protein
VDGAERQAFSDRSDFGVLNLDARGVEPRFGGSYGVLVPSMGDGQVALEGLRLPEALTLPALSPLRREPPGELTLTWTGSGADPLRILLTRRADAVTRGLDYYVACEVTDDGTFTIPAAALQHVPLGPVDVALQRRHVARSSAGRVAREFIKAVQAPTMRTANATSRGPRRPRAVPGSEAVDSLTPASATTPSAVS